MTWVLYNDTWIIPETDESLVSCWLRLGYTLHGQSEDEAVISLFVDEINAK